MRSLTFVLDFDFLIEEIFDLEALDDTLKL